jgi:hypothetical protein
MFVKTIAVLARFCLVMVPIAAVAAAGCGGGDDKTGTAGSSGTAGSTGTAGTTGTGGTGTGGTVATKNCTVAAATAADANILDFNAATAGATQVAFGNYMPATYGGGTFIYPDAAMKPDLMGLSNSFDGMAWHITGLVKEYAGFGLYLTSPSDVSMFAGMEFDIKGTLTPTGAGTVASQVTMSVTDKPHEVDSAHTMDGRMTCGMCAPASEYDGTCAVPTKVIPLTGTVTTQTVRWNDLTGGRRPPSFTGESPNPALITAISWVLPWMEMGAPYNVDITVDNIKFITP